MNLAKIADVLGCSLPQECGKCEITGIASPDKADAGTITFLSDPRYRAAAVASPSVAVIVKKGEKIPGKICLEVNDPYLGYARVALLFENTAFLFDGPIDSTASIHPTASIDPGACIGPLSVIGRGCVVGRGTRIGASCVIENESRIGRGCCIHSGAIICRDTVIGDNVIVESGAVIGSEGFGNARDGAAWVRIPSFGNVVIEDDVWIGANTTIDRGALGPTVIRRGARLDNLIQIAHNVEVGEDTAIAAQAGLSGSTKVGKRVIIAGQAGFVGHIDIGDDAFVGAKAGVSKSVDAKARITGYPARDFMRMRRIEAAQQSLPDALKEIRRLRAEVDELRRRVPTEHTEHTERTNGEE